MLLKGKEIVVLKWVRQHATFLTQDKGKMKSFTKGKTLHVFLVLACFLAPLYFFYIKIDVEDKVALLKSWQLVAPQLVMDLLTSRSCVLLGYQDWQEE